MRWALAVVLVAAAATAATAKPRQDMDMDFDEPPPCARAKTWPLAKRCLAKTGIVAMIYETDTAKVVTVVAKEGGAFKQVVLYAKVADGWMRASFNGSTGPSTELLRVEKFVTPNGDGVRIDMGTSFRTLFALERGSRGVPGILRNTASSVCIPSTWACRSLRTACEAYVHGKVYWSFHGEVVWHPTLGVRMRGATTAAGTGNCRPVASELVNDE